MPEKEEQTLTGGIKVSQSAQRLPKGVGKMPQSAQNLTIPEESEGFDHTLTRTFGAGTGELVDKVNWEPGDVIDGRYEVVEVIGRGGKGIVYKVNHLEWNLELAVKMPLSHLVADRASKVRFIHEAQTWVNLGLHPNIVQCWYVRELGGVPRVFMDYIDGGSLKDWIHAGKVKPGQWETILDLMIQACDGLGYAHELGMEVHRDVKPGNLLMMENGELRVTDFGIAKSGIDMDLEEEGIQGFSGERQAGMTVTGSELGTPEYGAPEQWGKARHADARADIYGLGVVLFELCCGRRPFDDGTHTEPVHVLIGRHLSTPAPDPRKFNENIPKDLADLILKCLVKEPKKRPESMTVLRGEFVSLHEKLLRKSYRRPVPKAVEVRSDALNNQAVSFLDLGKKEEALEIWREALRLDPYHPESVYNKALIEWNDFKITDEEVVSQLENTRHSGRRAGLYLGFVHLERTAADEAEVVLRDALKASQLRTNGIIWQVLGHALMAQGKFEKAERAYQRAMEFIPEDFVSLEGQTLAQLRTRKRGAQLVFPWQHCCWTFEGGHRKNVAAVAVTPDGRFAISGGHDMTLRRWDLSTRSCVWISRGHEDKITALAVTPDGQCVVSGGQDKTVRLWELETGNSVWTARGHRAQVTAVAVTSNGRFVLSGSRDMTLRLWSIATGKSLWTAKHSTAVTSLALTPDGRFALSGHDEENLYMWDTATGSRVERKFYGSSLESMGLVSVTVTTLAITPDAKFAVSGTRTGELLLWDVATGQVIRTYKGHEKTVTSVAVTPDGQFIISGSTDTTLRVWNIETAECTLVLDKHYGGVSSVTITPDGQFAVSGGQDTTVRLWDLRTGECLWTFSGEQGHQGGVTCVAMTPHAHGRFAVSGSRDMSLRLWDITTAECLRTFDGHLKEVTDVAVTPDGQLAVSACRDATLWVWEIGSAEWVRILEGHLKDVNAVVITQDGRSVISGSDDRSLRLWELETGESLRTFVGHKKGVTSIALLPDGRFIVSGSEDATVRLWNIKTAKCLRVFKGHREGVNALTVTRNGNFIVSGSDDSTLRLWDLKTGKCLKTFTGHKGGVTAVSMSLDDLVVISGGKDHTVRLWDIETAKCLRTFMGHTESITSLTVTPDGQFVLSGSDDHTLRLWNLELDAHRYEATIQVCRQRSQGELQSSTQRFQKQMTWAKTAWENEKAATAYKYLMQAREISGYERAPEALAFNATLAKTLLRKRLRGTWVLSVFEGHSDGVTTLALSPNGRVAVSGSNDRTLRSWDLRTEKCLRIFKGHQQSVTSGTITPDGRFVVSGSEDNTLRLWEMKTAKSLRVYKGHKKSVTAVTVTPYGRFIVSASEDRTLRLWNPSTAKCLRTFKGHRQSVTSVTVTPDRRFIVSGSKDGTLRLWDSDTTECLQIFKGHRNSVSTVQVAPNGQFVLSGSMDETLKLWNISSGKCLQTFRGHGAGVTSLTTLPDSRFVISGSKDKTLRLWNLATGECISVFEQHQQGVTGVALTLEGRFILSGSDDKTLRLWELDWELETSEITAPPGIEESTHNASIINRIVSLFNK